jgi:hypothetical protein
MAFDDTSPCTLPDLGSSAITATSTCLAVPVLHAQEADVPDDWPPDAPLREFEVEVPAGDLGVSVTRHPPEFAESVTIVISVPRPQREVSVS